MLRMEHISDEIGMHWTDERDPASRTGRDQGIAAAVADLEPGSSYTRSLWVRIWSSILPNPDAMHDAAQYPMVRPGMAQSSKGYPEAYFEEIVDSRRGGKN